MTSYHMNLINLSTSELVKNICKIICFSIYNACERMAAQSSLPVGRFSICLCVYAAYIFAMALVTADRLLASVLSIRYQSVCTVERAKKIVIAVWCFTFFFICPIAMAVIWHSDYTNDQLCRSMFQNLLKAILTFSYLLFLISTYVIIFIRYMISRRRLGSARRISRIEPTSKLLKMSNLFVNSFLVLTGVPYIISTTLSYVAIHVLKHELYMVCMDTMLILSDTVDALLYVFFYPPVRKLLQHELNRVLQWLRPDVSDDINIDEEPRSRTATTTTII